MERVLAWAADLALFALPATLTTGALGEAAALHCSYQGSTESKAIGHAQHDSLPNART